jgi:nicotinate-nucleotide pyrophosphorylase (carboxylating)
VSGLREDTLAVVRAAGLDPAALRALAVRALEEDLAGGVDVTSVATVPFDQEATAEFVARGTGVVAGVPVALVVLDLLYVF